MKKVGLPQSVAACIFITPHYAPALIASINTLVIGMHLNAMSVTANPIDFLADSDAMHFRVQQ